MKNNFPIRLRELMEDQQLTQQALAEKANTSQTSVMRWLAGSSRPHPRALADLAVALGVRPAWLEDGTEPRDLPLAMRKGKKLDIKNDLRISESGQQQYFRGGPQSEMEQLSLEELIDIVEGMPSQISMANNPTVRSRLVADAEAAARELRVRSSLVIPK
jgi:transcriptional regulator with XRE-family HTH domain